MMDDNGLLWLISGVICHGKNSRKQAWHDDFN
jgi:hypothetical protein